MFYFFCNFVEHEFLKPDEIYAIQVLIEFYRASNCIAVNLATFCWFCPWACGLLYLHLICSKQLQPKKTIPPFITCSLDNITAKSPWELDIFQIMTQCPSLTSNYLLDLLYPKCSIHAFSIGEHTFQLNTIFWEQKGSVHGFHTYLSWTGWIQPLPELCQ